MMDLTVCMDGQYSRGLSIVKRLEYERTSSGLSIQNGGMAPPRSEVQIIAQRLREAREAMDLSQADVCRLTGIRSGTYNQWEQAVGRPEVNMAKILRAKLGWTLDYIYEGDTRGLPFEIASKLPPRPGSKRA